MQAEEQSPNQIVLVPFQGEVEITYTYIDPYTKPAEDASAKTSNLCLQPEGFFWLQNSIVNDGQAIEVMILVAKFPPSKAARSKRFTQTDMPNLIPVSPHPTKVNTFCRLPNGLICIQSKRRLKIVALLDLETEYKALELLNRITYVIDEFQNKHVGALPLRLCALGEATTVINTLDQCIQCNNKTRPFRTLPCCNAQIHLQCLTKLINCPQCDAVITKIEESFEPKDEE